jgi:hypothetical protein
MQRFGVSTSAGQQGDRRVAVIDRHDHQGGKGARRVSWHRTVAQAQAEARRRNGEAANRSTFSTTPHYGAGRGKAG